MANYTVAPGKTTKWMGKESFCGLMANFTKDFIKKEKNMVMVYYSGRTADNIKGNGRRDFRMEKESFG